MATAGEQAAFFRENGYLVCRGVFDDAEVEELRRGVDAVISAAAGSRFDMNHWGQGLMVAGENPEWFERRPRYDVRPVAGAAA